jgi:hypothetical protein
MIGGFMPAIFPVGRPIAYGRLYRIGAPPLDLLAKGAGWLPSSRRSPVERPEPG